MKKQLRAYIRILGATTLVVAIIVAQVFVPNSAHAAQITSRSLTLEAGATDGGSMPGGTVRHFFQFTVPGGGNLGSIKFEYCTTAAGTCTTPTGLVTTGATLVAETGITGFSMTNTTNGAPYLGRVPATVTAQSATFRLGNIVNPTNTNETFIVRISTYATNNATGAPTDTGNVAASTATQILIDGTMPESLVFCTGATVTTNGSGVPDCATATAGNISFNQLFSPTDTATTTSQMAASTNAGAGYSVTVNGPTLTSGANTITGMGTAGVGVRGTSQFGLNLKANTTATSTVAVGTEVDPVANGTNYRGQATTGYNTSDTFKFTSGDVVADSAFGGAGGTDAQIFTVSYIVNVPGSQPAGTYTSTLTYICTPTF